ncbi:MAG: transporter substrate-binding domain-containing protein [Gammaproteobacteria bacterium]|nr:transporter substrate-binding domain-containing protein [Gammaproteobacteria bacterium]MDE0365393.1 transporter substrate-binding domain-containing protein [Gammaproteobacteria bacterium]
MFVKPAGRFSSTLFRGSGTLQNRFTAICLLAALLAGLAAPSALARDLDEIISDGTIRIGVNPNFPPMSSFSLTNQLEGFDIDIGNRIGKALAVDVELVTTETAQRVPFLVSNRIDIALGALTRTPARAKLISYTLPLHSETMGVITTDKAGISSWKDLNSEDFTLVNMRGNLSVSLLKERLPKPRVLLVDGNADTIRAIAQGRADALVENVDFFLRFTKNYPNVRWQVLDDPIHVAWCSIGVGKGNYELRDFLNILLYDLHSSGYIDETWRRWYGTPMAAPLEPDPTF